MNKNKLPLFRFGRPRGFEVESLNGAQCILFGHVFIFGAKVLRIIPLTPSPESPEAKAVESPRFRVEGARNAKYEIAELSFDETAKEWVAKVKPLPTTRTPKAAT